MTKHQKHLMDIRASKALADTYWCEDNECYPYIDGYKQGDADRLKIDVDKVRECLKGILAENMISAVCKAMED